jgi:hypothetical protein
VFFYGEYIHWDKQATQLEEWTGDALDDVRYRLFFLTAITQLAAVYVPFGELVSGAIHVERN